jgi:phosphoribosylformylglycinamidine synthase subunit PurL
MSELTKKLKHYRLSTSEYEMVEKLLGRPPQGVEWALFSALWSEHCSYKSSKIHLKKFYSKSERIVMSFGENAGVIDLGEGERVAFKMESHNHPSYIEPYEGAATGVGGILRDIFTMGARPIALANYLCFGEPKASRMTSLVDGVVRGIGGYGNCVGVPTITGQTEFHSSYNKNILVNALAVGLFNPGDPILSSKAEGVGNLVVYVGAKTGKDGVHGASMASESFDENSEAKKPTIQKGDPFYEKLLIESCIEVMKNNLVVAIQDMGAAGLTSSSFEMAARGGVGFDIHLDRVPLRDHSMTPEEILLSESQERMLMIVKKENLEKLKSIFSKWNLDAESIGEVTKGPAVQLFWHDERICNIDPNILVENAPKYERPYNQWQDKNRVENFEPYEVLAFKNQNAAKTLLDILSSVSGSSRSWVFNQYDQRVGTKTAFDCKESIGVLQLPVSQRALGLVLGNRPHVMRFDAKVAAIDSIIYPALELSAKGFLPLAATDCLNYGNPENVEIMSEFVATVEGMSSACEALHTPVISGNVSFYNETLGENITSTPSTGLVGLRQDVNNLPTSSFRKNNDEVFLLRLPQLQLQGLYAEELRKTQNGIGQLNVRDLEGFVRLIRNLALFQGVNSTRVVGKFGLAYALARMCTDQLGVQVNALGAASTRALFSETLYEVIFCVSDDQSFQFRELFNKLSTNTKITCDLLGSVRAGTFQLGDEINLSLKEIQAAYNTSWEVHLAGLS